MRYLLIFKSGGKKYNYSLTDSDILQLMRATYKEGSQKEAVAYTLLNRFAWLYPQGTYKNLSSFISAYAQPINPKWFLNGSAYLAKIKVIKNKYSGSELKARLDYEAKVAAQRKVNAELDISQIPDTTKKVVNGILNGNIKNPVKGSVHFIASMANKNDNEEDSYRKQVEFASSRSDLKHAIRYDSAKRANNWFFTTPGSENFTIQISPENIMGASLNLPVFFIGSLVLWIVIKRFKGNI